jgi:hypothetical protein
MLQQPLPDVFAALAVFLAPGGVPVVFDHDRVNNFIVGTSDALS